MCRNQALIDNLDLLNNLCNTKNKYDFEQERPYASMYKKLLRLLRLLSFVFLYAVVSLWNFYFKLK